MEYKRKERITAKDLGIDLASKKEEEVFKWFLACLLFSKPIQQEVAGRTYFEFEKEGLTSPDAILQAGWDQLVKVLDRGHYVRYDESTATKLLEVAQEFKEKYGTMTNLLKQAKSVNELSKLLQKFKGVGPKTAQIFIRGLRQNGWEFK
ncbi:MAG: DNA methylase [Patescibacteria group bacterium]|nr:DNA methylase [Patescibacteria group bacterium]